MLVTTGYICLRDTLFSCTTQSVTKIPKYFGILYVLGWKSETRIVICMNVIDDIYYGVNKIFIFDWINCFCSFCSVFSMFSCMPKVTTIICVLIAFSAHFVAKFLKNQLVEQLLPDCDYEIWWKKKNLEKCY